MKKLNNSGFTLVELLAVIVVLALLMVVAASSIGNSLNNAKKSSMATEGEKVVAKTYEDLKMKEVDSSFDYTYANVNNATGAKDGDYTIKIKFNAAETKMTEVCIDDGKNYSIGTVAEAKVTWGASQFAEGTCSSFVAGAASSTSSSST